jgi:flagellar basal-body rod protein FlgG
VIRSLWSAATGMLAQQAAMDATANNLSNINTAGFKKGRTAFQDLLYDELSPKEAAKQGSQVGLGTRVAGVQMQLQQGALQQTGNPLDLAIEGEGFFQVRRADGSAAFTRAGQFTTNAQGQITTPSGDALAPPIKIPGDATDVTIGANGAVSAKVAGKPQQLGRITLATFTNPYGLASSGSGVFTATAASGAARTVTAGQNGLGSIRQGTIEASNVDAADEMVGMIQTQRAYEAVAKVISSSDEMLQMANQLRS